MTLRPQILDAAKAGPLTMDQIVESLGISQSRRHEVVSEVLLMVRHWELKQTRGSGRGRANLYDLPGRVV